YFQQALELSPDHLVALENLGNAYRAQKHWDEARKVLEHAVAIGPEDPDASYSLGMVFAQLNDTQQAYEYLQRALKLQIFVGLLSVIKLGKHQAYEYLQRALKLRPGYPEAKLQRSLQIF